jgi:hypothetical protein
MENTISSEWIRINDIKANLANKKLLYSKLYKLYTLLNYHKNFPFNKECIIKIHQYSEFEGESLTYIQTLFLRRIILRLIEEYNKKESNNTEFYNKIKDFEEEMDNKLKEKKKDEFFKESDNIKDKNLYDILKVILKYFMEKLSGKNEREKSELVQKWENMGLNLENFENSDNKININELSKYYDSNVFIYLKKNPNLLFSETYLYLKYKVVKEKKEKKEKKNDLKSLKDGGDEERLNDDYGREPQLEEENIKSDWGQRIPLEKLRKVFEKWRIIYHLDQNDQNLEPKIHIGNNHEQSELYDKCHYENIDEKDKNYIHYKNYARYLWFNAQVYNYIKQCKDNNQIKLKKATIILDLTTTSDKQSKEDLSNDKTTTKFIDIRNVKCKSFVADTNSVYTDENVLVYGIHDYKSGFIYFINELCNDDYENYDIDNSKIENGS